MFDRGEVRIEAPNGEQIEARRDARAAGIHTHSPRQTFYVDHDGLIRRHDYTAEPVGGWAHAIHYCTDHQRFDGLVFPTRRRVHPRAILVALDLDRIEIDSSALWPRSDPKLQLARCARYASMTS